MMRVLCLLIAIATHIVFSYGVEASEVKIKELQRLCQQLDIGAHGKPFNREDASRCRGYLDGFFDSMIIFEELTKTHYFCVPSSLSKTTNTQILQQWVTANPHMADDATATVALFSAYKMAFPCK